jgi:multidrug efflux pump subunit AcrA (membrane-fusion protein)
MIAVSASVLTAIILFVCLVPVPVSRIRGQALVEAKPAATGKLYVRHDGILVKLNVRPGDQVNAGDVLAVFEDRELDVELRKAVIERDHNAEHINILSDKKRRLMEDAEKGKVDEEISKVSGKHREAEARVKSLEKTRETDLILRAPCSGTIGVTPSVEDVSKFFPADPNQPFITINQPGQVRVCVPVVTPEFNQLKESLEQVSDKARATRKLMKQRVTVSYEKARLADVVADLQKQVKGLHFWLDKAGGANEDLTVSYQGRANQRLGMELDALFGLMGLGYVIVSDPEGEHDGWLQVRVGHERGEPEGGRPLTELDVTIRFRGRDRDTWKGKIRQLPESEAKTIPLPLSNRGGGPVAVKASTPGTALIPATQHYLVYVEIIDPDEAILPGTMAQVKIYCQPETCLKWLWRTLNNTFDLGLM